MIKKIIAVMLLAFILVNTVAFAGFELGNPENEIILSGVAAPFDTVSILLLNSDNMGTSDAEATYNKYKCNLTNNISMTTNEIFFFETVKADEKGIWSYRVNMTGINNPVNLTFVSSHGDLEYINYAPVSYRKGIITLLKEAALKNDDYSSLSDTIKDNIGYISSEISLYNSLISPKGVAVIITDTVLSISGDEASLKTLSEKMDNAVIIEAVKQGKVTDFNLSISVFPYDENVVSSITDSGKLAALSFMKNGKYNSFSDYEATYSSILALYGFNYNKNMAGENLYQYLNANRKYFTGVDFSGYDTLQNSDCIQCLVTVASKKSSDLTSFSKNLNDEVTKLKNKRPLPGASGGGGGGGGGGTITAPTITSAESSVSNELIEGQKYVYSDLSGYEWALDAISYLSQEGILSGYQTGEFKPQNPVTRAEFIKMIVATFYKYEKVTNDNVFIDVKKDSWYHDYINIAYQKGLVNGTSELTFSPDEKISRQDMAVIIYKVALKFGLISETVSTEGFLDDAIIADYAKEAVYTLKNAKIINGMGDGSFSPKDPSNRASAAQILYSLIISSKEAK